MTSIILYIGRYVRRRAMSACRRRRRVPVLSSECTRGYAAKLQQDHSADVSCGYRFQCPISE